MTDTRKTDGEILHACLVELDKKVDTVDVKLAHVVEMVDKLHESLVKEPRGPLAAVSDEVETVASPLVSKRGKNNGEASGSETVVSTRKKGRA